MSLIREEPEIVFSGVGGHTGLKSRLWELAINPVEDNEQHRTYGVSVPNGILFAGPSGTGKSHMAKALAGELNRTYMAISLAEIRDSLAGESEKNVKKLFEQTKEHQPVLIIDEVDAILTCTTENTRWLSRTIKKEQMQARWDLMKTQAVSERYETLDTSLRRTQRELEAPYFTEHFSIHLPVYAIEYSQ